MPKPAKANINFAYDQLGRDFSPHFVLFHTLSGNLPSYLTESVSQHKNSGNSHREQNYSIFKKMLAGKKLNSSEVDMIIQATATEETICGNCTYN